MALLLFTSFGSAVYFLIVMATICPIILNTTAGVFTINPQWIKMAMIIAIGILGFILDRCVQKLQHTFSWE